VDLFTYTTHLYVPTCHNSFCIFPFHRPQFRRSGPSTLGNLAVATLIGTLSGYYIFGIPLRQHWEEQQQNAAAATKTVTDQNNN
jgi:hypothetical protein